MTAETTQANIMGVTKIHLARWIQNSIAIHERSWVPNPPGAYQYGKYSLTQDEACYQATRDEAWANIISILLMYPNDALIWAHAQLPAEEHWKG